MAGAFSAPMETLMPAQLIFFLEVGFGYLAWVLAFRTYGWPRLKGLERADALRAIATLHSFRFFGLAFLLPGVVGPSLPAGFARAAALGDFATGVLAIAALLSFRVRPLFWGFTIAFNVWGLADLILDTAHGVQAKLPRGRRPARRRVCDPDALRAAAGDHARGGVLDDAAIRFA